VLQGHWLRAGDPADAVVLNHAAQDDGYRKRLEAGRAAQAPRATCRMAASNTAHEASDNHATASGQSRSVATGMGLATNPAMPKTSVSMAGVMAPNHAATAAAGSVRKMRKMAPVNAAAPASEDRSVSVAESHPSRRMNVVDMVA
jgi:hypothetical protein